MPEHVHLLLSEPERGNLALGLQMLKQLVSHTLRQPGTPAFWEPRYFDLNVWSERKVAEKLDYLHLNPVKRGARCASGRLVVEQCPALRDRSRLWGGDRITMDSEKA